MKLSMPGSIAVLLLATAPPVVAQQAAKPAKPARSTPFTDYAFGFQIDLPTDWMLDRTAFPGPKGSHGLIRGRDPAGRGSLQILMFRDQDSAGFPVWIDSFAQMIGRVSDTQSVKVVGNEKAVRPEAIVAVDSEVPRGRTCTLYYCVQFDDGLYWVFSLAGLLGADEVRDRAAVRSAFEQMIGTLRVTYDPRWARAQDEALARGVEFKRTLATKTDRPQMDGGEHVYEIRVGGAAIGYLTRRVQREERVFLGGGAARGLRVSEQSWRFGDDGSALYTQIDLFSSDDLKRDLYEITHSRIPAPPAEGDKAVALLPETTLDQCIREGDQLICSFRNSLEAALPDPRRPLALDESYLGLAWVRALPVLLGPQPGPPRGFVTYDPATRGTLLHVVESLGRQPLPEGGRDALAYRTREGFSPASLVYFDERGVLLRMESGDLVLRRSEERTVDEAFRARRQAALARLAEARRLGG